jgi:hypothetical protein
MATQDEFPGIEAFDDERWTVPDLIDEVLALYGEWRAEMAAVEEAYNLWIGAGPGERHHRFAAYRAALDQEEAAAAAYVHTAAELRTSLQEAG